MNARRRLLSSLSLLFAVLCSTRCSLADIGNKGPWGDQADGTFKNPVLPGDFSDPDVIRVGADYYFITSTFQYSPGIAILHSKDLVNWQYIGHGVNDLTQIGPELNWDRMNRYNRGIYAGAIRYHDGKFWIFFTTMDEGVFMTTAQNPAGPWAPLTRITGRTGFDDPCPLWDDDGKAYLLLSTPGPQWWTRIYTMSPDGKTIDLASEKVIDNYQTSEGNKIYKFGSTYYVFHNEVHGQRVGVMMRSKNIYGPYEKKIILESFPGRRDREPNQGGLVQTPRGDWWFITHQGRGENGTYDGRPSHLLPVQWIGGWPIPGLVEKNGAGTITWTARKPVDGFPIQIPQGSDDFTSSVLAPQWEWNYQPRPGRWSLTERPGWLRLHALKPLRPGDFFKAADTLTQRVMGTEGGEVVVKMDVSGMSNGQKAGLSLFWKDACQVGVTQTGGVRTVEFQHGGKVTPGPAVGTPDIWLKAVIDSNGLGTFAYSLDGTTFTAIGDAFPLGWANYRGSRLALYSYNDRDESGYVDVDFLHYRVVGPGSPR